MKEGSHGTPSCHRHPDPPVWRRLQLLPPLKAGRSKTPNPLNVEPRPQREDAVSLCLQRRVGAPGTPATATVGVAHRPARRRSPGAREPAVLAVTSTSGRPIYLDAIAICLALVVAAWVSRRALRPNEEANAQALLMWLGQTLESTPDTRGQQKPPGLERGRLDPGTSGRRYGCVVALGHPSPPEGRRLAPLMT